MKYIRITFFFFCCLLSIQSNAQSSTTYNADEVTYQLYNQNKWDELIKECNKAIAS